MKNTEDNESKVVEPPLFIFLKQYGEMISGSKLQKLAIPMITISAIFVVAGIFLTVVPSIVTNIVVALSGLASVIAAHSLLAKRDIGPGQIKRSNLRYMVIINSILILGLFVASSFVPYALGGYLSIILVLNVLVYWFVEDRIKNLAVLASIEEAERALKLELEQTYDEDEDEDYLAEDDDAPDDERWSDYLEGTE